MIWIDSNDLYDQERTLAVKVKEFLAASLYDTELNRNLMDQYFLLFTTFLSQVSPVFFTKGFFKSKTMAAVTSGLLTIVKTGITIVSYFGNVTASLFALTIVRKFTPR